MPDPSPAPARRLSGLDVLTRVGVVVFAVGLVAVAAVVVPFAVGRTNPPTWLSAVAGVGLPLGMGLALVGLLLEARRPRE